LKLRKMNLNKLKWDIKNEFTYELLKLQREYVKRTDGLYNASSYPGKVDVFAFAGKIWGEVSIFLINPENDSPLYLEYGTGIYMPDWWSPAKTEAQRMSMGSAPRKIPRDGKYISPRGSPWYDLSGGYHQGWHMLIFDVAGFTVYAKKSRGIEPRGKLEQTSKLVFNIDKLEKITNNVFRRAFSKNAVPKGTVK